MPVKKPSAAMEFIVDSLKRNRGAAYKDIKANADKKRLKVYPIMFGRAQALLGIVKSAPRGQGKFAKAKAAAAAGVVLPKRGPGRPRKNPLPVFGFAPPKRGPGRPRKNPLPMADLSSLDGIISAVKSSQQQRERMRSALQRIQSILADALS
jgi:hypothetical protein